MKLKDSIYGYFYLDIFEDLVFLPRHVSLHKRFLASTIPKMQDHIAQKSKNYNIIKLNVSKFTWHERARPPLLDPEKI